MWPKMCASPTRLDDAVKTKYVSVGKEWGNAQFEAKTQGNNRSLADQFLNKFWSEDTE